MKYIILALMLFQAPKVITLKEYYCGEAVIFDEKEKYPFSEINYAESYVPRIEDVKKGEIFLFENYYEYEINISNHYKFPLSNIKSKYKKPENVKRKFYKYNRQYISYINTEKDTILYIGLLNFSNKKKANQNFDGWKTHVIAGFGDFYYENQKFYIINLSKRKFIYKVMGMENGSVSD